MSLAELRGVLAEGAPAGRGDEDSVRRQWWAALATLQEDLIGPSSAGDGLWLAAPLPALYEPALLRRLHGWVWTPAGIDNLLPSAAPALPGGLGAPAQAGQSLAERFWRLPLREEDGTDPLLVVITARLQVALAVDGPAEGRRLLVRFDAPVLSAGLSLLDRRLQEDDPGGASRLRQELRTLGPLHNDPSHALRFWPLMAQRLARMAPSVTLQPVMAPSPARQRERRDARGELALLEALTHEVRTPLATIRTLIRSLLRRKDLTALVRQRLEQIDGECSEQIDQIGRAHV